MIAQHILEQVNCITILFFVSCKNAEQKIFIFLDSDRSAVELSFYLYGSINNLKHFKTFQTAALYLNGVILIITLFTDLKNKYEHVIR